MLNLKVTDEQLALIDRGLCSLPYGQVVVLMQSLIQQVTDQKDAEKKAAAEALQALVDTGAAVPAEE